MTASDMLCIAAGFLAAVMVDVLLGNLCWRSSKLNRNPGLYLRVSGKWYRIMKTGGQL